MTLAERVQEALSQSRRSLTLPEIAERTALSFDEVAEAIQSLLPTGRVIASRKRGFGTPEHMGLTLCHAIARPDAPCFARPVDGGDDAYLRMDDEIALDGDLILVRMEKDHCGRSRASLNRIVARAHTHLIGTLHIHTDLHEARLSRRRGRPRRHPEPVIFASIPDRRLPSFISVEGSLLDASNGALCRFEVLDWPSSGTPMRVRVAEILGASDDVQVHIRGRLSEYGIHDHFDEATLRACEIFPEAPDTSDLKGREDLRSMTIFTIDGADAKDFDDAVSLETCADQSVRLGVHIADVAHYVQPGTALDREAEARGTSVYLPGLTLPMLPEILSNGLCSLQPNCDRLTLSVFMTLKGAQVTHYELKASVIRSCARLTYDDVNDLFAARPTSVPDALHDTLRRMNALAHQLSEARWARGAIDLDLPEPSFTLDAKGDPIQLGPRPRGEAHQLIEEFMLLANETVARHARLRELPFPYRIHESPDSEKLVTLETMLASLNRPFRLGRAPHSTVLAQVIKAFRHRPEATVIDRMMLRSMSRARYWDVPMGHYGLALKDYCHFTSPIRRYPDLVAHRMLTLSMNGAMDEAAHTRWSHAMREITERASEREEAAARCERDVDRMMCAAFIAAQPPETVWPAKITGIFTRGALVTLPNTAEGILPLHAMDDEYEPDSTHTLLIGEYTRRVIRLGDAVAVQCQSARIATGDIEWKMAPSPKKTRDARSRWG